MTASAAWVPGDPLHKPSVYSNYLFNFRDEHDCDDICLWSSQRDAASWPTPRPGSSLDTRKDELETFIADWRAAREDAAS